MSDIPYTGGTISRSIHTSVFSTVPNTLIHKFTNKIIYCGKREFFRIYPTP